MRKFCLQWMVCLGLVLMAGSAMAFSLNTDFSGDSIVVAPLTTSSGQNQWNDLVRWQIQNTDGSNIAAQHTSSGVGHETSLLYYGFDATGLGIGTQYSLEFDFINNGLGTSAGRVFLGGLNGSQTIVPNAPWTDFNATAFLSAPIAVIDTDVWTHASYIGTVTNDFEVIYVAFRMGGETGLRAIDNVSLYVGSDSNGTAPVPEPSTFLLLGAGMAGLALWRRKKIQA